MTYSEYLNACLDFAEKSQDWLRKEADVESFEHILYKAAESLGVEIV